jgi:hypothetical protein
MHGRETCSTGRYFVAFLLSNLWITFLLPKSYVGNVSNVVTPTKLTRKHTARVMARHYCHIDIKNKVSKVG